VSDLWSFGNASLLGPDFSLPIPLRRLRRLPIDLEIHFPGLFRRSANTGEGESSLGKFLLGEGGAIALAYAECAVSKVQVPEHGEKRFAPAFEDALRDFGRLVDAKVDDDALLGAFADFVDEFGTHYSKTTILGAKTVTSMK